ncbi:unnamed protein product [Callosobruchus maculatus]|uniref:Uncharacterized protein n=1 Tax=Callosobruchus maculatus TaxID=64391 RepID=A0A653CT67_CALMS|nr:unnamed protein product [Callosobruchus maculatus]
MRFCERCRCGLFIIFFLVVYFLLCDLCASWIIVTSVTSVRATRVKRERDCISIAHKVVTIVVICNFLSRRRQLQWSFAASTYASIFKHYCVYHTQVSF